jgi:CRISPR-associated protein Csd2
MCDNFYDIRMFGAVMTTGKSGKKKNNRDLQWNCGQVRGPVQLTFGRSIDPIIPLDLSITRVALTNPGDVERADIEGAEEGVAVSGQMGRKPFVPYGLYRAHGFFIPSFAAKTGASAEDLATFWQALQQMWDLDRSAARGMMACRGLYVFTHDSPLGNAPAHQLFDSIRVARKNDGVARSFADYQVSMDEAALPSGVTLSRLVG